MRDEFTRQWKRCHRYDTDKTWKADRKMNRRSVRRVMKGRLTKALNQKVL